MEEAALQLGLEKVGKGKAISRQKEEHCKGEEGEPGCRRGLGSVHCRAGSWASLQKGFPVGAETSAQVLEAAGGQGRFVRRAVTSPVFQKEGSAWGIQGQV